VEAGGFSLQRGGDGAEGGVEALVERPVVAAVGARAVRGHGLSERGKKRGQASVGRSGRRGEVGSELPPPPWG